MNKENLIKMADHLETIPDNLFDMRSYRVKILQKIDELHICNSVACVVGHCTVLDTEENLSKHIMSTFDMFDTYFSFYSWGKTFTGLEDDIDYGWLFSGEWNNIDNTRKGAIKRIRNFVANDGMTEKDKQFYKENFRKLRY